jgi:N-carbamoyl-L-amino-acid hydrolase
MTESSYFTPELATPSEEDFAEFTALFERTSSIGATPAGGLHRLAASVEDGRVRDLFRLWLAGRAIFLAC